MKKRNIIKNIYQKFSRLKGDPQSIARGTAIGTFIGITPTMPLRTIIITIITISFPIRANTLAALLASAVVSNPLTYFPQYYFSIFIGNWITPYNLNWDRFKGVIDILISNHSFTQSFKILLSFGMETIVVLLTWWSFRSLCGNVYV